MIEYSSDFKANHKTAYLAEEFERLEAERSSGKEAAGEDAVLREMAAEDEERIDARQKEILSTIAEGRGIGIPCGSRW
jgi:hypothetical protein